MTDRVFAPEGKEYLRLLRHDCILRMSNRINGFIRKADFVGLNKYIADADLEKIPNVEVLTLCRQSYCVRYFLPDWQATIRRAHAKLKKDGADADLLLKEELNAEEI